MGCRPPATTTATPALLETAPPRHPAGTLGAVERSLQTTCKVWRPDVDTITITASDYATTTGPAMINVSNNYASSCRLMQPQRQLR
jgi:hypothetical protein